MSNIFHRLSATFASKVENVVSHIEDNDAVVEAALKDTGRAIAKARVRLARVQKDGQALREKLASLNEMQITWTNRAKETAATDEEKALQCVGRLKLCKEQAAQTQTALKQHEELERSITETVARMEQRQGELTQQRNLMRSRHSAADAMRIVRSIESQHPANGLDDAFERWEMQIMETEYNNSAVTAVDSLDASFTAKEDEEDLKAALAELLQDTPKKKGE